MGCHTNFYKPANLTYRQVKELAINELTKQLEKWTVENILHTPNRNGDINPYNWTEETVIKQRAFYTKWLRRLQNSNPSYIIISQFVEGYYMFRNNKLYTKYDKFDDCFRVGWDLADRQLTSLEETLQFVENNKDKINFCRDSWLEEITEFWQLYPEGIIDLG